MPLRGHNPCRGEREDFQRATFLQNASAGFQCCASSAHVVYQDYLHSFNIQVFPPAPAQAEDVANVGAPFVSRQFDLCAGVNSACEAIDDPNAQMPGELAGLIESALMLPTPVQWHRHDAIRLRQQVCPSVTHQVCQRACHRTPAAVLQSVNDFSECSVVLPDGPRSSDPALVTTTTCAPVVGSRQGVPAHVADWRRDGADRQPARLAHASPQRFVQHCVAHYAGRRQNCRKKRVGDSGPGIAKLGSHECQRSSVSRSARISSESLRPCNIFPTGSTSASPFERTAAGTSFRLRMSSKSVSTSP